MLNFFDAVSIISLFGCICVCRYLWHIELMAGMRPPFSPPIETKEVEEKE